VGGYDGGQGWGKIGNAKKLVKGQQPKKIDCGKFWLT